MGCPWLVLPLTRWSPSTLPESSEEPAVPGGSDITSGDPAGSCQAKGSLGASQPCQKGGCPPTGADAGHQAPGQQLRPSGFPASSSGPACRPGTPCPLPGAHLSPHAQPQRPPGRLGHTRTWALLHFCWILTPQGTPSPKASPKLAEKQLRTCRPAPRPGQPDLGLAGR